jgi:hypothetical protein
MSTRDDKPDSELIITLLEKVTEPVGDSLPFAEPAKPISMDIAMEPAPTSALAKVAAGTAIQTPAEIESHYRYRNKPLPIDSWISKLFTRDNGLYLDVRIPAHIADSKPKRVFFRLDKVTETIKSTEDAERLTRTSFKLGRFDERDVEFCKTPDGKVQPVRHGVYRPASAEDTKLFLNALTHQIENRTFELCDVEILLRNVTSWVLSQQEENQRVHDAIEKKAAEHYAKALEAGIVQPVKVPSDPVEAAIHHMTRRPNKVYVPTEAELARLQAACTQRWPNLYPALFEELNPSKRVHAIQKFVADFPEYHRSPERWVDEIVREVSPSERGRFK